MEDIVEKIKREREQVAEPPKEYKIVPLNDILKMTPKENPFILKGMIVEGSVNALTSDSGKGKSLLMLKMVEAITSGEKFLGEFETKQCKTLIIDLEMSENDIIQRTQSIIHHEIEGLDFYHAQTFNICNTNDFNWLKDIIKKNEYKLVVLDTYSMAHNKNENDNTETNIVNHKLLELVNEYGITILFLHHHRKLSKGEVMSQASSRGATDIIGKTASHLLIDTRDTMVADGGVGLKGIKIVVEQMKRRQATGFERYSVYVCYHPDIKQTTFEFGGYDEKAENATEKTKTELMTKMEVGNEYTRKELMGMTSKSSNLSTALKELIEIERIVGFRMPTEDEEDLNGKKIARNTKIYFLQDKDAVQGVQNEV